MRASDVGLVRGACGGLVAAHTFASLVGVVSCVCVNRGPGVCLCVSGLSVSLRKSVTTRRQARSRAACLAFE